MISDDLPWRFLEAFRGATEVSPPECMRLGPGDHPARVRYATPGNSRVALAHGAASWSEGAGGRRSLTAGIESV